MKQFVIPSAIVVAIGLLIAAANYYRYVPIGPSSQDAAAFVSVWDRWGHRVCVALPPQLVVRSPGVACTISEFSALLANQRNETDGEASASATPSECVRREQLLAAGFSSSEVDAYLREQIDEMVGGGTTVSEAERRVCQTIR